MVGALDERQPRDDFWRRVEFERVPPSPGRRCSKGRHQAEVALGFGDRGDHGRRAHMRHERHREAEVEARAVTHVSVARGEVGMHGKRRLHIGEGRDDDAPDALHGIERQDAFVAVDQAAHHVGLARGAEGGAGLLRLLDGDQPVNDLAAFHEEPMHRCIDAIDVAPQVGERGDVGRRVLGHGLQQNLCPGRSAARSEA